MIINDILKYCVNSLMHPLKFKPHSSDRCSTFKEGKISAMKKPLVRLIASLIADMNASWSLHFLLIAVLDVMPYVKEKMVAEIHRKACIRRNGSNEI